ncbi:MAG: radical SAM family heme chaperone HemW [Bacteroidetes bacterium]|nr:radical SAM family heme chaperone HemW [Bacteroidota bacterium]
MAGIYFHIPFCKQACHYCNFHFATSLRLKEQLVKSLEKEINLQAGYLQKQPIETIYFGGGTPSLLSITELENLLKAIQKVHSVDTTAEITLEVNPDDITVDQLKKWKDTGVNRLSIGIQSFNDTDLKWMNRAHNAKQAMVALEHCLHYFENCTLDLIYGLPHMRAIDWKNNIDQALQLGVPHLSCYALTVESRTPLEKQIKLAKKSPTDPDKQAAHFELLMDWMEQAGFRQYEISNFAKPGWESKHNQSYWQGKWYLGIGPSAHSFDGISRQWNIANNANYIKAIEENTIPFEKEVLTTKQQTNEKIMTALRTDLGLKLSELASFEKTILQAATTYIDSGHLILTNQGLQLTRKGKCLADGIAAALFVD